MGMGWDGMGERNKVRLRLTLVIGEMLWLIWEKG